MITRLAKFIEEDYKVLGIQAFILLGTFTFCVIWYDMATWVSPIMPMWGILGLGMVCLGLVLVSTITLIDTAKYFLHLSRPSPKIDLSSEGNEYGKASLDPYRNRKPTYH